MSEEQLARIERMLSLVQAEQIEHSGMLADIQAALEKRPAPAAASAPRETTGLPPNCYIGLCQWREKMSKAGNYYWDCTAQREGEHVNENGYCRLQARTNSRGWGIQDPEIKDAEGRWEYVALEDR